MQGSQENRDRARDFGWDPSNAGQWMIDVDGYVGQLRQDAHAALYWSVSVNKEKKRRSEAEKALEYLDESRLPHQGFEEFLKELNMEAKTLKESVSEL